MAGVVRAGDFHAGHTDWKGFFHQSHFSRTYPNTPTDIPVPGAVAPAPGAANCALSVQANGAPLIRGRESVIKRGDRTACGNEALDTKATTGLPTTVQAEGGAVALFGNLTASIGSTGAYPHPDDFVGYFPSHPPITYFLPPLAGGLPIPVPEGGATPSIIVSGSLDVLAGAPGATMLASAMGLPRLDISDEQAQDIMAGQEVELQNGIDPAQNESVEHVGDGINPVTGFSGPASAPSTVGERDNVPFQAANFTVAAVQPHLQTVDYFYELWVAGGGTTSGGRIIYKEKGTEIFPLNVGAGYAAEDTVLIPGTALGGMDNNMATIRIDNVYSRKGENFTVSPSDGSISGGTGYEKGEILQVRKTTTYQGSEPPHVISIYFNINEVGTNGDIVSASSFPGYGNIAAPTRKKNPMYDSDDPNSDEYIDLPDTNSPTYERVSVTPGRIFKASISGTPAPFQPGSSRPETRPVPNSPTNEEQPTGRYIIVFPNVTPFSGEGDSPFPPADIPNITFNKGVDPRINPDLARKLGLLAAAMGTTLTVNSAYRSPAFNASIGGARRSSHLKGEAADVSTRNGIDQQQLLRAALAAGLTGTGVYSTFIHVDIGPKRAWGPNGSRTSLPGWAQAILQEGAAVA